MHTSSNINFKNNNFNNLLNKSPKSLKHLTSLVSLKEAESGLSHVKFIEDTATNLLPKIPFARSKADISEISFMELNESALVYYMPGLAGEKIFRKAYSSKLPEYLKKQISTPALTLLKDKKLDIQQKDKLIAVKSAISMACMCVPLAEYSLSYLKNLFTLKIFNQADFNNIANLNKNKKEDKSQQEKVKKSAIKHIGLAAAAYGACLATSAVLAIKGDKSKLLQNLSKLILTPGSKLFSKNPKLEKLVNKYFSLDFADNGGKLALSRGQLTSCILIGGVGYFGSAKDRGKQNFLEVLTRFPLVGFYVITGSELLENGFKKFLHHKKLFKNLINDNLEVPKLKDVPELAEKLSKKNGTSVQTEFNQLIKGKGIITGVPFIFSIGIMGFFVAGMSTLWTKFRFNQEQKMNKTNDNLNNNINKEIFKNFSSSNNLFNNIVY